MSKKNDWSNKLMFAIGAGALVGLAGAGIGFIIGYNFEGSVIGAAVGVIGGIIYA